MAGARGLEFYKDSMVSDQVYTWTRDGYEMMTGNSEDDGLVGLLLKESVPRAELYEAVFQKSKRERYGRDARQLVVVPHKELNLWEREALREGARRAEIQILQILTPGIAEMAFHALESWREQGDRLLLSMGMEENFFRAELVECRKGKIRTLCSSAAKELSRNIWRREFENLLKRQVLRKAPAVLADGDFTEMLRDFVWKVYPALDEKEELVCGVPCRPSDFPPGFYRLTISRKQVISLFEKYKPVIQDVLKPLVLRAAGWEAGASETREVSISGELGISCLKDRISDMVTGLRKQWGDFGPPWSAGSCGMYVSGKSWGGDRAVVSGAALYAAMVSGDYFGDEYGNKDSMDGIVTLENTLSGDLLLVMENGDPEILLKKDCPLPVHVQYIFRCDGLGLEFKVLQRSVENPLGTVVAAYREFDKTFCDWTKVRGICLHIDAEANQMKIKLEMLGTSAGCIIETGREILSLNEKEMDENRRKNGAFPKRAKLPLPKTGTLKRYGG